MAPAARDRGGDDVPAPVVSSRLPRTWRLHRAGAVPVVVAAALASTCLVTWVALPADTTTAFSRGQLVTVVVCVAVPLVTLLAFAACRVRATEDELVLVNVYRVRRIPWHLVVGLRFRPDDPWPILRLADDVQVGVMGIQKADGPRSRVAAAELADVIIDRTGGPPEGRRGR